MPLHDWNEQAGWEGVHTCWIVELLKHVRRRLPEGWRAYIGSTPAIGIDAPPDPPGKPDLAVRHWLPESPGQELPDTNDQPDSVVATFTLDPQVALYVAYHNRLAAAVELISPRNKDRPSSRDYYLRRYLGYLREGVHLLLVDVHPRPFASSFPNALAEELRVEQPSLPSPCAAAYRSGSPSSGERTVEIWRRPLAAGAALPTMTLPLGPNGGVRVDLEATYTDAVAEAYFT